MLNRGADKVFLLMEECSSSRGLTWAKSMARNTMRLGLEGNALTLRLIEGRSSAGQALPSQYDGFRSVILRGRSTPGWEARFVDNPDELRHSSRAIAQERFSIGKGEGYMRFVQPQVWRLYYGGNWALDEVLIHKKRGRDVVVRGRRLGKVGRSRRHSESQCDLQ